MGEKLDQSRYHMWDSKDCVYCKQVYYRPRNLSIEQWESRRFCSIGCKNRNVAKAHRRPRWHIRCTNCGCKTDVSLVTHRPKKEEEE